MGAGSRVVMAVRREFTLTEVLLEQTCECCWWWYGYFCFETEVISEACEGYQPGTFAVVVVVVGGGSSGSSGSCGGPVDPPLA